MGLWKSHTIMHSAQGYLGLAFPHKLLCCPCLAGSARIGFQRRYLTLGASRGGHIFDADLFSGGNSQ